MRRERRQFGSHVVVVAAVDDLGARIKLLVEERCSLDGFSLVFFDNSVWSLVTRCETSDHDWLKSRDIINILALVYVDSEPVSLTVSVLPSAWE